MWFGFNSLFIKCKTGSYDAEIYSESNYDSKIMILLGNSSTPQEFYFWISNAEKNIYSYNTYECARVFTIVKGP